MTTDDIRNMECPPELSDLGVKAWEKIMDVLEKHEATDGGGCRVFYSPQEWKDRGESYGGDSELIVVYDGGDHGGFFSLDRDCCPHYKRTEEMRQALSEIGLFFEECTCWYAAVYRI